MYTKYKPSLAPVPGSDKTAYLKENERFDDLQLHGLEIIQHPDGFCFGMDAVLLSHFATVKKSETVVDLGTGTGILPILLAGKTEALHIYGLEIQEQSADMAARSVLYNGLDSRIDIVQGDIKEASNLFSPSFAQVVTCNPPYMSDCHGIKNPNEPKAIARHEILCTLEDVISQASRLLTANGRFYMVHRPFRLPEIISVMKQYKLEPKTMQLVYPSVRKEPNMLLIEGRKGGNPRLKNLPPIIVYNEDGTYTEQIFEIYGMQPERKSS